MRGLCSTCNLCLMWYCNCKQTRPSSPVPAMWLRSRDVDRIAGISFREWKIQDQFTTVEQYSQISAFIEPILQLNCQKICERVPGCLITLGFRSVASERRGLSVDIDYRGSKGWMCRMQLQWLGKSNGLCRSFTRVVDSVSQSTCFDM